jgi:Tfp pilus assembly protein PilF
LLAALSVFRGGWTLDAAEEVADADLELMQSLLDKSLIRRWDSERFGMLETIREFAAEQLEPSARDRLRERLFDHLLACLTEAANLSPHSTGPPRIDLATSERPNVDVALGWALETGKAAAGLQLLEAMEAYWTTNDPTVGRERLDAFLGLGGTSLDPTTRAKALRFRGASFDMTGRYELSEGEYLRARELALAAGDSAEAAHLTQRIAMSVVQQGDLERASGLLQEALASSREPRDRAIALAGLARVALGQGDLDEGARLSYESAQLAESIGWTWWRGVALATLADFLIEQDPREAEELLLSALESLAAVGDRGNITLTLATAAVIAARRGNRERAGTLWGAFEREAELQPRASTDFATAEAATTLEAVHGAVFEEARRHGRRLSLDEAVDYALRP